MEPTGDMDNKSCRKQLASCEDEQTLSGHFTVCDLADEEVHFSRSHSSDFHYQHEQKQSNGPQQHQQQQQHHHHHHHHHQQQQQQQQQDTQHNKNQSWRKSSALTTTSKGEHQSASALKASSTFNSLDLGGTYPIDYHHLEHEQQQAYPTNQEQVASSRFLNTLGNKLRRGSNYLNAPTRLLGQYLLGITIKSWSEFFNSSRMMKAPTTRHQLSRRLFTNLSYFQGNYLCVSLVLVIYCILTSPLLLIAIAAYLVALYLVTLRSAIGKQTRILGYRLNLQQQYSFITMASLPPLWIAGAPSALFWVIGASFFVVGLHASMYSSNNEQQLMSGEHLSASSRATHSLAVHTPTLHLSQQQQAGAGQCTQLGKPVAVSRDSSAAPAASSRAQYYNHYPGVAAPSNYAPLSQVSRTKIQQASSVQSGGSYVSQAISHWITFGTRAPHQPTYGELANDNQHHSWPHNSAQHKSREPGVKIISRDYAGLGRVYEI